MLHAGNCRKRPNLPGYGQGYVSKRFGELIYCQPLEQLHRRRRSFSSWTDLYFQVIQLPCMLSKLATFRYDPLLVLQHVHDYLLCQNRYNMSVLPRMKLKNELAGMWIDWPCIDWDRFSVCAYGIPCEVGVKMCKHAFFNS